MDVNCKKLHLANKLENVGITLDGDDCWQINDSIHDFNLYDCK